MPIGVELFVDLFLPAAPRLLASHPALPLALGIPSVDRQQLIHTPVLVPLEEEDLAIGPGQRGVRAGWHTGE